LKQPSSVQPVTQKAQVAPAAEPVNEASAVDDASNKDADHGNDSDDGSNNDSDCDDSLCDTLVSEVLPATRATCEDEEKKEHAEEVGAPAAAAPPVPVASAPAPASSPAPAPTPSPMPSQAPAPASASACASAAVPTSGLSPAPAEGSVASTFKSTSTANAMAIHSPRSPLTPLTPGPSPALPRAPWAIEPLGTMSPTNLAAAQGPSLPEDLKVELKNHFRQRAGAAAAASAAEQYKQLLELVSPHEVDSTEMSAFLEASAASSRTDHQDAYRQAAMKAKEDRVRCFQTDMRDLGNQIANCIDRPRKKARLARQKREVKAEANKLLAELGRNPIEASTDEEEE